jgi:hypothetical protein
MRTRCFERAEHPWRAPAGRKPERDVGAREIVGCLGAGCAVILGALSRLLERANPTREARLVAIRRDAERRLKLGGIQRG